MAMAEGTAHLSLTVSRCPHRTPIHPCGRLHRAAGVEVLVLPHMNTLLQAARPRLGRRTRPDCLCCALRRG